MWLADGTSLHLSSALITALVIGIPSVVVAFASYRFSVQARREALSSAARQVDAEAYARAQDLYESAIAELRQERADLQEDNARLREQLARRSRRATQGPGR